MEAVTEKLCEARMATLTKTLETIQTDGKETRKGVGNLNRRLFEGNGGEAFDTLIKANTAHRLRQEDREEAKRRFGWTRNLGLMVAGAGWAIACVVYLLQR